MQIKRFEAKNMTAALREIKAELGPEAVILSARSLRKGKSWFGSMRYAGVEVTAAVDASDKKAVFTAPAVARSAYPDPVSRPAGYGDPLPDEKLKASANIPETARHYPNRQTRGKMRKTGGQRELSALYQQILSRGVDRGLASELIDEIKRVPAYDDLVRKGEYTDQICTILEEMGVAADITALSGGKPNLVALIGATGVGKTTTIAKLAAIQLRQRGKQVALISIDNYGIAANEQLKAYARILGLSIQCVVNSAELLKAIKKVKHHDLILIDTPGFNPIDPHQIRELNSYFAKISDLHKLLVVSAATKEKDLLELGQTIEAVGVRSLIFTKLDESRNHGNMLNMMVRTHLPVAYFCCGRKVSDDLEVGSVKKIFDLLFQTTDGDRRFLNNPAAPLAGDLGGASDQSADRPYFIANRNSDVFHTMDCKWSHKIKSENIVHFSNSGEAAAQQFLPCRSCHPDQADSSHTGAARTANQTLTNYR